MEPDTSSESMSPTYASRSQKLLQSGGTAVLGCALAFLLSVWLHKPHEVLLVLDPGLEDAITGYFAPNGRSGG